MPPIASRVLILLYLAELSAAGAALTWMRRGDRPLGVFVAAPAGWAFAVTLAGLLVLVVALAWLVARVAPPRRRRLAMVLAVNVISLALGAGAVEALVRLLATPTIQGPSVAGTVLLPRSWEDLAARSRALLDEADAGRTYLVPDAELGWTIGPGRQSTDYNRRGVEELMRRRGEPLAPLAAGSLAAPLYVSSVEGLRSARPDTAFARVPARRRVAVVGDSFTFGLEVPFEAAWPAQLERLLGDDVQVLNFGVDGYGLDQAYLRYRRDVAAWRAEIAVLGMIDDDVHRTMCVYAFLCFSGFGMPFGKPRLVLEGPGLTPLNLPLPPPRTYFGRRSIGELPHVALDGAYDPVEWTTHAWDRSYALRFVRSRYRPWSEGRPGLEPATERALNAEIVRAFVRLARERGARPIVAYFPSRPPPGAPVATAARDALAASGVRALDLTACVEGVLPAERFVALHYSARTNAAVAGCLRDAIARGFAS